MLEQIKNIVNMQNVDNNVDTFIEQFNMLNNSDYTSLDDILNEMKQNKLNSLMNNNSSRVSTGTTKYSSDEERRLARNESSRRSHEKRRMAEKAALAELQQLKKSIN